ncbi:Rpn family recombination-promoting nuclease/putative transposase [Altericista sp. CCNU0014]|uniref:Rpn family recombination-promoting nuclease/putative transposase n=1 Tax=Altericista sp. CCNU0014 TaxID=3082949 RepID=UPI00384E066D
MAFDNLCKLLAEKHPVRFASWVLGQPIESAEVLKSELSIEPIRADSVILLKLQGQILHLEFQVKLDSEPPLPLRMLDYWVRLYRLYRLPIRQVVVLLRPPAEGTVIESAFVLGTTRHEYQVLCMWEQDPSIFLEDIALLPLAILAAAQSPEQLLNQVAQRVSTIESVQQRREASAYVQLLAGLRFDKTLIRQVFREDIMRESVIYQEIQQEGEERGILKGKLEGEQTVILRLLARRVGDVSPELQSQIQSLTLYQLEALADALLDFSTLTDLRNWLQTSQA